MKRIPVAVAVLLLVTGLCVGALWFQQSQTRAMIGQIDEMLARFDPDQPDESLPDADALYRAFREKTALFPLFLRHSGLTEIETELKTLPHLLTIGEPKDVPAVLARCRNKLQTIYELECPTIENVF